MLSSYRNVYVLPIRNFRQWDKNQAMVGLYWTYGQYSPLSDCNRLVWLNG